MVKTLNSPIWHYRHKRRQGGRRRQVLVRMGEVIFAIVDDHETLINRSAK